MTAQHNSQIHHFLQFIFQGEEGQSQADVRQLSNTDELCTVVVEGHGWRSRSVTPPSDPEGHMSGEPATMGPVDDSAAITSLGDRHLGTTGNSSPGSSGSACSCSTILTNPLAIQDSLSFYRNFSASIHGRRAKTSLSIEDGGLGNHVFEEKQSKSKVNSNFKFSRSRSLPSKLSKFPIFKKRGSAVASESAPSTSQEKPEQGIVLNTAGQQIAETTEQPIAADTEHQISADITKQLIVADIEQHVAGGVEQITADTTEKAMAAGYIEQEVTADTIGQLQAADTVHQPRTADTVNDKVAADPIAHQIEADNAAHEIAADNTTHEIAAGNAAYQIEADNAAFQISADPVAHQIAADNNEQAIAAHTVEKVVASNTFDQPAAETVDVYHAVTADTVDVDQPIPTNIIGVHQPIAADTVGIDAPIPTDAVSLDNPIIAADTVEQPVAAEPIIPILADAAEQPVLTNTAEQSGVETIEQLESNKISGQPIPAGDVMILQDRTTGTAHKSVQTGADSLFVSDDEEEVDPRMSLYLEAAIRLHSRV